MGKGKGKHNAKNSKQKLRSLLGKVLDQGASFKKAKQHAEKRTDSKKKVVRKARMLYKPSERILVLGDGDCSFSRSLVQLFSTGDSANESGEGGCHVTCTTFDDEKTLLQKYGTAQDHVQVIRDHGGRVFHGIDATQLEKHFKVLNEPGQARPSFDKIVFHFPHTGAGIKDMERNVAANQKMLTAFFPSAYLALADSGEIHVTVKRGEPYDKWRVPALGTSTADLWLKAAEPFDPSVYPGYEHRRTIGFDASKSTSGNEDIKKGALTYIFMKESQRKKLKEEQDDG